jgi:hypothetical protein
MYDDPAQFQRALDQCVAAIIARGLQAQLVDDERVIFVYESPH